MPLWKTRILILFTSLTYCRSYIPEVVEVEPEEDSEEERANAVTNLPSGIYDRLVICKKYINGQCTLTTCPHAHPHLRDRAKVTHMRYSRLHICP